MTVYDQKPWVNSYDKGVPSRIDYPNITINQMFEETVRKYPNRIFTEFKGTEHSYSDLKKEVDCFSSGLYSIGIRKGDRVGVLMLNTPQFVITMLALMKIGAIVVATNPLYTVREIIHQANNSEMTYMIAMTNFYEKVKEAQPHTSIKQVIVSNLKEALPPLSRIAFSLFLERKNGFYLSGLEDNDIWFQTLLKNSKSEDLPEINIGPDDIALLQYTGGTTGVSKGAIATHRVLVSNVYQINAWMTNLEDGKEVILGAVPFYHSYGMVVGIAYSLMKGATLPMVPDPRNIDDVLAAIERNKVTVFPSVPAMFNAINKHSNVTSHKTDITTIKACISGSAPLPKETKETWEHYTKGSLTEGYGLSETPVVTHCNPQKGINKTGSIGLPFPDVECKIVDVNDANKIMPIGKEGELLIKGPQMMMGYYNNQKETETAICDGWLYTGDVVYMDEDGYFFIVGRKKDSIKPGGFQVWPDEIENVLLMHKSIKEAGVAGVLDENNNEAVKAWLVIEEDGVVTPKEIQEFCKEFLTGYKIPRYIEFLDQLPRTHVGKLLRRELIRIHNEKTQFDK